MFDGLDFEQDGKELTKLELQPISALDTMDVEPLEEKEAIHHVEGTFPYPPESMRLNKVVIPFRQLGPFNAKNLIGNKVYGVTDRCRALCYDLSLGIWRECGVHYFPCHDRESIALSMDGQDWSLANSIELMYMRWHGNPQMGTASDLEAKLITALAVGDVDANKLRQDFEDYGFSFYGKLIKGHTGGWKVEANGAVDQLDVVRVLREARSASE